MCIFKERNKSKQLVTSKRQQNKVSLLDIRQADQNFNGNYFIYPIKSGTFCIVFSRKPF